MYRNNFWRVLAEIWPKKTISRDGCGLLADFLIICGSTGQQCLVFVWMVLLQWGRPKKGTMKRACVEATILFGEVPILFLWARGFF